MTTIVQDWQKDRDRRRRWRAHKRQFNHRRTEPARMATTAWSSNKSWPVKPIIVTESRETHAYRAYAHLIWHEGILVVVAVPYSTELHRRSRRESQPRVKRTLPSPSASSFAQPSVQRLYLYQRTGPSVRTAGKQSKNCRNSETHPSGSSLADIARQEISFVNNASHGAQRP
jgi:hypothetical protein